MVLLNTKQPTKTAINLNIEKVSFSFNLHSLLTACLESGTVCQPCSDLGHQSIYTPLGACQSCLESGSKCVKLLVLLWTADCKESNKQAMEQTAKLSTEETENEIKEQVKFLKPIPEAVHLGKCLCQLVSVP